MSEWTTERPTKPGWYWCSIGGSTPRAICVRRDMRIDGIGCNVSDYGRGDESVLRQPYRWLFVKPPSAPPSLNDAQASPAPWLYEP